MDVNPSLESFLATTRKRFNAKVEHDLREKTRHADVKRYFELACRRRFPTLQILWKNAHIGMMKTIVKTYSSENIQKYINYFVDNATMHDRGLSFDGFYHYIQKVALEVANAEHRATIVAARKAIADTPQVPVEKSSDEIEKFKQSPFFKRMPKGFQEKIK